MRRKGVAGCCLLTIYIDLSRRYKALDSLSRFVFCFLIFLFLFVPTIGFRIFTLAFISKVTHGKDVNFSSRHLQYEILSFFSSKRLQWQGRWFACDGMQLRAWLKQKKNLILCLELMLQTWRRRMLWFTFGSSRPLVMAICIQIHFGNC